MWWRITRNFSLPILFGVLGGVLSTHYEEIAWAYLAKWTAVSAENRTETIVSHDPRQIMATAFINDVPVHFLVDTGATEVVLSYKDALRVGIDVNSLPNRTRWTLIGPYPAKDLTLKSIQIGGIIMTDVRASVSLADHHINLLGMSFIGRLKRFEYSGGILVLKN